MFPACTREFPGDLFVRASSLVKLHNLIITSRFGGELPRETRVRPPFRSARLPPRFSVLTLILARNFHSCVRFLICNFRDTRRNSSGAQMLSLLEQQTRR